ncbi:MAG: type II toxin-antitoxin system VapC family toxin [Parvularculaceae bacterium]|nr:type II toxin-antitoxin system VapC family toxin [Parvularculaceae bacterium]
MPFVVDASIVAGALLADEQSDEAAAVLRAVARDSAFVPGLFWNEVRNLLLSAERRKRLPLGEGDAGLAQLRQASILVLPDRGDREVLALARAQGLSAYDAAYLALAKHEGIAIATLDQGIRRAAAKIGVALWALKAADPA